MPKAKLWLVTPNYAGWDMYTGFVIRAESARRAKQIVIEDTVHVPESTQTWSARQIKEDGKEEIVLSAFQAG